jgi:hypothetical protein
VLIHDNLILGKEGDFNRYDEVYNSVGKVLTTSQFCSILLYYENKDFENSRISTTQEDFDDEDTR